MALEVFIMPLYRYLAGDYVTTGSDGKPIRRVAADSRLADTKARATINRIKRSVQRDNPGITVEWRDEGDSVYSRHASFIALRTYARWFDCQHKIPEFMSQGEDRKNLHKHRAWSFHLSAPTFTHVVDHTCQAGYLLPVDFPNLAKSDPITVGKQTLCHPIGSSHAMLREIEGLREFTQPPPNFMPESTPTPQEQVWLELDHMTEICRLSIKHGLPVIFNG